MSQSIALQAQNYPINLPGIVNAAQDARLNEYKLQNAPLAAEVERLKLEDEQGQQSALNNYRLEAGKTDPVSALPTLNAYPELQSDFDKRIGDLPPEERRKAVKKSLAYAEAAKFVMGFPDGSPEQKQAWNSSVDALEQEGFMDPRTAEMARKSGPSKMLLMQAVDVGDILKSYGGRDAPRMETLFDSAGREYKAQWDGTKWVPVGGSKAGANSITPTTRAELNMKVEDIITRMSEKDVFQNIAAAEIARRKQAGETFDENTEAAEAYRLADEAMAKKRAELRKSAGLDDRTDAAGRDTSPNITQFDLMTAPGRATSSQMQDEPAAKAPDGSQANPYPITTPAEANALPSGAYFVDPNGVLRKKK